MNRVVAAEDAAFITEWIDLRYAPLPDGTGDSDRLSGASIKDGAPIRLARLVISSYPWIEDKLTVPSRLRIQKVRAADEKKAKDDKSATVLKS